MAGDPGVDLGPGSFQPRAHLIGLGKLGSRDQICADEQLPVDRQPPPGPCPPVRAKPLWVSTRTLALGAPVTAAVAPAMCGGSVWDRHNARLAARI